MPINKSQADLLKSGFLDSLGSDDRGIKHAGSALIDAAVFLISRAQDNLNKKGSVATGSLSASIRAEEVEVTGGKMTIPILLNDYWEYVDQGVKGTNGGTGKFQFKSKYPSKKMALAILKWMRRRNIRAREFSKYPVSKSATERKDEKLRKSIAKTDSTKSLAYAISTNIKKRGIRPTKFLTNAVRDTRREFKNLIGQGFRADIIETIKNEFNTTNIPR